MNKLYEEALTKRIKSELAKEIHDELGNALAVISSRIKIAKLKLQQNDHLEPGFFDKAEDTADKLLKSTKDFIWTVGSSNENPIDIFYYLKDIGEELFDESDIRFYTDIERTSTVSTKLSTQQSYQIVLMFKEALTNVAKHSKASEIHLGLSANNEGITLAVSDNGVGFDKKIKTIQSGNSYGLKNISHRAAKIGGLATVHSKVGIGTSVTFSLGAEKFRGYNNQSPGFLSGQAS